MEVNPLRHPILFGEYELTIDEKNRLPVPSGVRKMINPDVDGDAFFLVFGQNRKPWLYPKTYYQNLVTQIPADMTPGDDRLAFDQMSFALAEMIEWDPQGRIRIPEKLLRRTGLNKDVTLIGVRDHLELWNREDWDAKREELIAKHAEITARVRQSKEAAK